MQISNTTIPAVKLVTQRRFGDERGFLIETFQGEQFRAAGITVGFQQDNLSYSAARGTVRGLHFQIPPADQAKLVFVLRGAIVDVAVDLRANSRTFGQHVACVLDDQNDAQLYIPCGFAHGFVTLQPDTLVYYKISSPYSPEHERGILWNDPDLAIDWKVSAEDAVLSERDRHHSRLREIEAYF